MNKNLLGWIYLLITIFFFSTIEVATKPFRTMFDPLQITFLRFLFGGIFLLMYPLFTGKLKNFKLTPKLIFILMGIGGLNSILAMGFLQFSVKFGSASTAAILVSSNPIFVLMLAPLFLNEKITKRKIAALLIGLSGIFTIIFSNSSGDSIPGFAFGLLAASTFALYTVLVKKYVKNIPSVIFVPLSFLFSSIPYYIILKIMNIPVMNFPLRTDVILMLAYISLFITGIAYITFFKALEILDASVGSFSYLLKPAIASFLSFIFLNEIPNNMKLIGMALVITAVGVIAIKPSKNN